MCRTAAAVVSVTAPSASTSLGSHMHGHRGRLRAHGPTCDRHSHLCCVSLLRSTSGGAAAPWLVASSAGVRFHDDLSSELTGEQKGGTILACHTSTQTAPTELTTECAATVGRKLASPWTLTASRLAGWSHVRTPVQKVLRSGFDVDSSYRRSLMLESKMDVSAAF